MKEIKTTHELYSLIEKEYGTKYLENKGAIITFKADEYLIISVPEKEKKILKQLKPLLKQVMQNNEPICSYDLHIKPSENNISLTTIEWDLKNPKKRIEELKKNLAYSNNYKIKNFEIWNNFEQENERIYGIDPGNIKDVEQINNLNELELYLAIDTLKTYIWKKRYDMIMGKTSKIDLTEEQYALEYMMYQTKKFGVCFPKATAHRHISATTSYIAWYNFYDNHFKNILTDDQWNDFQKALKEKQDISKYKPTGKWNDRQITEPKKKEKR